MSSEKVRKDKDGDDGESRYNEPQSANANRPRSKDDIWDMELRCVRCEQELYVEDTLIDEVFDSLDRAGAVMLICTCGQAQIVRHKYQHPHY